METAAAGPTPASARAVSSSVSRGRDVRSRIEHRRERQVEPVGDGVEQKGRLAPVAADDGGGVAPQRQPRLVGRHGRIDDQRGVVFAVGNQRQRRGHHRGLDGHSVGDHGVGAPPPEQVAVGAFETHRHGVARVGGQQIELERGRARTERFRREARGAALDAGIGAGGIDEDHGDAPFDPSIVHPVVQGRVDGAEARVAHRHADEHRCGAIGRDPDLEHRLGRARGHQAAGVSVRVRGELEGGEGGVVRAPFEGQRHHRPFDGGPVGLGQADIELGQLAEEQRELRVAHHIELAGRRHHHVRHRPVVGRRRRDASARAADEHHDPGQGPDRTHEPTQAHGRILEQATPFRFPVAARSLVGGRCA